MTKQTKWHVRLAKTQISLGAQRIAKDPSFLHTDSEGSDQIKRMSGLSLRWAHMPFCWFCHEAAHY